MNITAKGLQKAIANLEALEEKLQAMPLHKDANRSALVTKYDEKFKVSSGGLLADQEHWP